MFYREIFTNIKVLHLDPDPDQHFECCIHADLDQATQINPDTDPQPRSSQLASTPSQIKKDYWPESIKSSSRIHRSCTGVKASFKVGLNWS